MAYTPYHPAAHTARQPAIGEALAELATATRHLVSAVFATLSWAAPSRPRVTTRAEEAAEARAMADRCLRTDPRMAADIYCAADRHERAGE